MVCKNGNKILLLIWIFGSLYAYCGSKDLKTIPFKPPKLYNQSEAQVLRNTTWYVCSSGKTVWTTRMFMTANFVLTFALPLIIITVCYLMIARKLINNKSAEKEKPLRRNSDGNCDNVKVSSILVLI
jgi:hypothetical protein